MTDLIARLEAAEAVPDRRRENDEYRERANARDRARYIRIKNDPEYKERVRRTALKMRTLYPNKQAARLAVRAAIKRGEIVKMPCEICGCVKSQAHHDDYDKPLDVRWLCVPHHNEHHTRERLRAKGSDQ